MSDLREWGEALLLAVTFFAFGGTVCLILFACMVAM